MPNLVESIKKAAMDANEASKPVAVMFGTVISASPLKISVEQKMTLESAQVVLTKNVTDHTVEMTVNHATDYAKHSHTCPADGCSISENNHNHTYSGRKKFTVHNGLVVGDEVILLRMQGGQKFIVLDRTS